jgi:hypothetical protein
MLMFHAAKNVPYSFSVDEHTVVPIRLLTRPDRLTSTKCCIRPVTQSVKLVGKLVGATATALPSVPLNSTPVAAVITISPDFASTRRLMTVPSGVVPSAATGTAAHPLYQSVAAPEQGAVPLAVAGQTLKLVRCLIASIRAILRVLTSKSDCEAKRASRIKLVMLGTPIASNMLPILKVTINSTNENPAPCARGFFMVVAIFIV